MLKLKILINLRINLWKILFAEILIICCQFYLRISIFRYFLQKYILTFQFFTYVVPSTPLQGYICARQWRRGIHVCVVCVLCVCVCVCVVCCERGWVRIPMAALGKRQSKAVLSSLLDILIFNLFFASKHKWFQNFLEDWWGRFNKSLFKFQSQM
jgi:hypothetical protein